MEPIVGHPVKKVRMFPSEAKRRLSAAIRHIHVRLFVVVASLLLGLGLYFSLRGFRIPHSRPRTADTNSARLTLTNPLSIVPALRVTSLVQHGRILEIQGSTEPGAVVMINGSRAATFFPGNSFKHFVGPLPPGTHVITLTSQNDHGGVNTQQLTVDIQ